ncbi:MAG TPA: hypothetical protein VHO68_07640, partial [Bacteroidales bacterium]|nr:hypothetical protein [Bacteroidales bacterium]
MTYSKTLTKGLIYVVSGLNPLFFLILFFLNFLVFPWKLKAAAADSSNLTVLETVNSFLGHWCSANDNYLYGIDYRNPARIVRKLETGQLVETRGMINQADTGALEIARIYGTSTPGLIFVVASSASNNFILVRSADGGLTFEKVFVFGEGNNAGGTNSPNVRMLRGLLELTHDLPGGGGKGTLFIGEYNFYKPRTPGGLNDRVRIMKSEDNGKTWIKVMEWNTNGTNQVGHVHAMKQDPYTGEIYICVGDANGKAGIIKWNGASAWSDNATLKDLSGRTGFSVFTGSQRYRVCDVLFDENYFYTFADTQTPNNRSGSESGIWRGAKDFSSYTRMNNHIFDYDPMHIGWFGVKIDNRFIFTTARETEGKSVWREANTQVYTSDDGL